jgi:GNAT superfamily N-acetyltransferase
MQRAMGDEESMIHIEEARPEDAEWIAGFQVRMARESENLRLEGKTTLEGVRKIFDEPSRGFYLSAKDGDGTPVGCLLIQKEWSDWRNAEAWWFHSVYVLPAQRKRGVFREMFDRVEAMAGESGVFCLRLYVDKGNALAQDVYTRLEMGKEHYALFEKML